MRYISDVASTKTFSAPKWKVFAKIRVPNAYPYILSALKVTATAADRATTSAQVDQIPVGQPYQLDLTIGGAQVSEVVVTATRAGSVRNAQVATGPRSSFSAADIRSMPLASAQRIYREHYWATMHCDELPAGLDYCVFDYAVNSGTARAPKVSTAQRPATARARSISRLRSPAPTPRAGGRSRSPTRRPRAPCARSCGRRGCSRRANGVGPRRSTPAGCW